MNNRDTFTYVKNSVQTYILGLSIEDQVRMLEANFGRVVEYIGREKVENSYGEILMVDLDTWVYSASEWEEQIDIIISELTTNEIIGLWSQIVGGKAELSDGGRFVTWPATK